MAVLANVTLHGHMAPLEVFNYKDIEMVIQAKAEVLVVHSLSVPLAVTAQNAYLAMYPEVKPLLIKGADSIEMMMPIVFPKQGLPTLKSKWPAAV